MTLTEPWVNYMRTHTDIPEVFISSLRYMLLACTVGRYFHLMNTEKLTRLNLYLILASPAGLYYRSEAVDYFQMMLECILSSYRKSIEPNDDDLKEHIKHDISSHGIPGGSGQGIADFMEELVESEPNGTASYLTVEHEMGLILKNMYGSSSTDLIELYIKMFKGETYYKVFSKRTGLKSARYIPKGTYFNMLGVMQDAGNYLTASMSTSGFVRRLVISQVLGNPQKEKKVNLYQEFPANASNEFDVIGLSVGKLMVQAEKTVKRLKKTATTDKEKFVGLSFEDDAMIEINNLTNKYQKDGRKQPDNPYFLFLGSHGMKVGKLSALEAIDRNGSNAKFITVDDVKKANDFLIELSNNIKIVLEMSVLGKEQLQFEKWLWQAKGVIYRYEKKHGEAISWSKLQTMFCGGYKCRQPFWGRVDEALRKQEKDIELPLGIDGIRYIGTEEVLKEHGIHV